MQRLNDILYNRLTDVPFISRNNNSGYDTVEFIKYIRKNRYKLSDWYFAYKSDDGIISPTIDQFCKFLLSNLRPISYIPPYEIGFNGKYYEPERYFTNANEPQWYPYSLSSDDPRVNRRLHIYKSPLYTNLEYLPPQYVGHYRLYAKPYLQRSIELTTPVYGYPGRYVTDDVKVHARYPSHWYALPTSDVILANRYKSSINPVLYHKLISGKIISLNDYVELTKIIKPPDDPSVFYKRVNDNEWSYYDIKT